MRPLRSQGRPASDELAAWELLRSVDPEAALSELSAARILNRVQGAMHQSQTRYPRWLVVAAAAAISLLCLQVAVAAVVAGVPALRQRVAAAVVRRLPHATVATIDPSKPQAPLPVAAPPVAPAPSVVAPAPIAALPAARVRHRALNHMPIASQPEPAQIGSGPEVEVMTQAARELYADHDPVSALATLEPYLYLHPGGSLRSDMILAAVQADLELDRTPEALGLLDGMAAQDFDGLPRASELRLLRGELLARGHRCPEALPVFEKALATTDGLQRERARNGLAACRAELGVRFHP